MSDEREAKDPERVRDEDDARAADEAAAAEAEDVQRRGRERMIGMWRAAVRTVTEAAQRATAHNDADAAAASEQAAAETPESTWVFPPTRAPGGARN